MKIKVLGLWGLETVGETPSFLLEFNTRKIILDACPALTKQLWQAKVKLPEVSDVIISHVHADHFQGLPYAIFARGVQARSYGEVAPIRVFGTKNTVESAKQLLKIFYPERTFEVNWKEVIPGQSYDLDDNIKLVTLLADHSVETLACKFITQENKILAYSSDGLLSEKLINFVKEADLLIQEAFGTMRDYEKIYKKLKHSLATHAGMIAVRANVHKLLLFHMHERYFSTKKRKEIISEVQENYSGEIIFPDDLSEVEL